MIGIEARSSPSFMISVTPCCTPASQEAYPGLPLAFDATELECVMPVCRHTRAMDLDA
jgi:hypothetical protein